MRELKRVSAIAAVAAAAVVIIVIQHISHSLSRVAAATTARLYKINKNINVTNNNVFFTRLVVGHNFLFHSRQFNQLHVNIYNIQWTIQPNKNYKPSTNIVYTLFCRHKFFDVLLFTGRKSNGNLFDVQAIPEY